MRASTGSISKALAAAATLVASIAVPALAIQVGALDALGFGAVVQAPQTPSGEVVVADDACTAPGSGRGTAAVSKKTAPPREVSVVQRSGARRRPASDRPPGGVCAEDRQPAAAELTGDSDRAGDAHAEHAVDTTTPTTTTGPVDHARDAAAERNPRR